MLSAEQATNLGLVLGAIAFLVVLISGAFSILVSWKKLTAAPTILPGQEYVTTSEMDRMETRLKTDITNLDLYCRRELHELRNKLQELENKIAVIPEKVRAQLDVALAPINQKLDRATVTIAKIATHQGIETKELEGT